MARYEDFFIIQKKGLAMNKIKLFLAVMLAVGMMQLHASVARSQLQNDLQDKLLEFKNGIGSYALIREKAPVIQALLFYCIEDCSDQLSYVKRISKFEASLSHEAKSSEDLQAIAIEIKNLKAPYFYRSESEEYLKLIKTCNQIIAQNKNVVTNPVMMRFIKA